MTSLEMRAYGEAMNRPDLILHSLCVEQREKLDALGDEFEALVQCRDFSTFPETLQEKIQTVSTYLLSGFWNDFFPFPEDGIFEEGRRLKEEVLAARQRAPSLALGDSRIVPFSGQGNRLALNRGQSYRID